MQFILHAILPSGAWRLFLNCPLQPHQSSNTTSDSNLMRNFQYKSTENDTALDALHKRCLSNRGLFFHPFFRCRFPVNASSSTRTQFNGIRA